MLPPFFVPVSGRAVCEYNVTFVLDERIPLSMERITEEKVSLRNAEKSPPT
jgi:hypothetical protein